MTHNESLLCTLSTKNKESGNAESLENLDNRIQIRIGLHLAVCANANSLILNVATIEFSQSFNYLDFNFNTCRIIVPF